MALWLLSIKPALVLYCGLTKLHVHIIKTQTTINAKMTTKRIHSRAVPAARISLLVRHSFATRLLVSSRLEPKH